MYDTEFLFSFSVVDAVAIPIGRPGDRVNSNDCTREHCEEVVYCCPWRSAPFRVGWTYDLNRMCLQGHSLEGNIYVGF